MHICPNPGSIVKTQTNIPNLIRISVGSLTTAVLVELLDNEQAYTLHKVAQFDEDTTGMATQFSYIPSCLH